MTQNFSIKLSESDKSSTGKDLSKELETGGLCEFFQNPLSNAVQRVPTHRTPLSWDKYEQEKEINGIKDIFEFSIKCLRRGNCQISMFDGDDEIVLSDNSKEIFVALLKGSFDYFKVYERDIENLRVKLSPSGVCPFLGITLSNEPKERRNQLKEAKKALKKFEKEISEIRIVGKYSYFKDGKKETVQFDGGVLSRDSYVRKQDENGNVISEGFRINPDFYYSLVNCYHIMQMPFTAFSVTGKNSFSIVYDLYAHSRENGGKREILTKTLLNHLGFPTKLDESRGLNFRRDYINRIVGVLQNAIGNALTSFSFMLNGKELDLDSCSNREWLDSTLVWGQLAPSETTELLESKEKRVALPKYKSKQKKVRANKSK